MQAAIQYLLGLGAAVVVGLIIFLIGLLVKAGVQRSLSAAITLGVAFSGVGLVIGYMVNGIAPAGKAMIDATGVQLNTLDFGWTAGAAITWAWQYAVLMFPVQIGINIAMLALKWTDCLNVDMWNVWGKIFAAALVSDMTGNVIAVEDAGCCVVVGGSRRRQHSSKEIKVKNFFDQVASGIIIVGDPSH